VVDRETPSLRQHQEAGVVEADRQEVDARLFAAEEGFDLVWTRPTKRRGADAGPELEPEADDAPQA